MPRILRREDGCKPMNKRRLRLLAKFLTSVVAKLPEERFRMSSYVHASEDEVMQFLNADQQFISTSKQCGTAACAMGWAPSEPTLRKEGIRIGEQDHDLGGTKLTVHYKLKSGMSAGTSFFDLTEDEFDWLFIPSCYEGDITPKRVAERIKTLIKLGGVPLRRDGKMDRR